MEISSDLCVGGELEQTSVFGSALVGNTLLAGVATLTLFGPAMATAVMATNVTLAYFSRQEQKSWFPISVPEIRTMAALYWDWAPSMFKQSIVVGIVWSSLGCPVPQIAQQYAKDSLRDPISMIKMIFKICILGPIVEEIIFRGFLQEKLKDLQIISLGEEHVGAKSQNVRVAIQAIAFGCMHYAREQGVYNIPIILETFLTGLDLGKLKEATSDIAIPILFHSHINSSIVGRIILFSR